MEKFYKVVGELLQSAVMSECLLYAVALLNKCIINMVILFQASNPGQFDSDIDVQHWQRGHTQDSVYHMGRVGVNTDHPDEAVTVHGNVKLTGHVLQTSDMRVKEDFKEVWYYSYLSWV